MARGFEAAPSRGGNDSAKLEELFDLFDPKTATKSYVALRFLPIDMLPVRRHWIQSKTKDGKPTAFPKMCVSFDPDNPSTPLKGRKCPFCELDHGPDDKGFPARLEEYMLANVIVRDLQDTLRVGKMTPQEKKTGFKDITSKSATPVRVIRIPLGVARRLEEMSEMNKGKKVTDPKYGIDVMLKFNPKAAPAEMYKLERGERTPITAEEEAYLVYNLSDYEEIYDAMGRLDSKAALEEFKRIDIVGVSKHSDDDDDDDGGFRAGSKSGKKKPNRDNDDEYEDEDEDEDEDDEDEPRSSRRKPSSNAKSRSRFADDDEEDEDEDDEDEPRSYRRKPSSKSKPSRFADDDEEEEEDEDDDEPRSSRRSKVTKKPSSKSKPSRFDDDEEEEDEDEDDEPRSSRRKPAAKSSRFADDDEEEEDEDEDDTPPKRSCKATSGRTSSRSTSRSSTSRTTSGTGRASSGKSGASSRTGSGRRTR